MGLGSIPGAQAACWRVSYGGVSNSALLQEGRPYLLGEVGVGWAVGRSRKGVAGEPWMECKIKLKNKSKI